MDNDELRFYHRSGCWIWTFFFGLLIAFIAAFWEEIPLAFGGMYMIVQAVANQERTYIDTTTSKAIIVVFFNIFIHFIIVLISLFFLAQFSLPARSWQERLSAFKYIIYYLLGWHGPAISVREGKIIEQPNETDNVKPGIALVDLSSAIVLEEQYIFATRGDDGDYGYTSIAQAGNGDLIFEGDRPWTLKRGELLRVRIEGPGLVFTRWGEKIISAIDLRKQVRAEPNVESFTRDGIELKNPVFVVFSLSDSPEIIDVGYVGDIDVKNIFGLVLANDKKTGKTFIKEKFALDEGDAIEIHNYLDHGIEAKKQHPDLSKTNKSRVQVGKTPYPFYPERVFKAAYAHSLLQGQGAGLSTDTRWDELPQRVAVDLFRKEMEGYNFDELFMMDYPGIHPLKTFKADFGRKMRMQGVVSYRFISPGEDVTTSTMTNAVFAFSESQIGEKEDTTPKKLWEPANLHISPARELLASKVLRDRGIKIIAAGFPEFRPAGEDIQNKLIDNWKARWDRDIRITQASNALEAIRTKNRARSTTQREMAYTISNLFNSSSHSKEALALRIFQAVEEAVANPSNKHNIAPREIFAMLQNLQHGLLQGRKDLERKTVQLKRQHEKIKKQTEQNKKFGLPDEDTHSS